MDFNYRNKASLLDSKSHLNKSINHLFKMISSEINDESEEKMREEASKIHA